MQPAARAKHQQQKMVVVRTKLATHWTDIFRTLLSKYDKTGSGTVTAF